MKRQSDDKVQWALLATLAAASAVLASHYLPGPAFGRGYEAVAIARALVEGHGYADAYGRDPSTGPTAHLPPVFPLFLAALIRLFGYTPWFALAADAFCLLAHAAHAVLLVPMSAVLFGSRNAGLWAAALSIALPPFLILPQWEAIYAAGGLMLFCISSNKWLSTLGPRLVAAARCGVAAGVLALLNSSTVMVTGTWLVWRLWQAPLRGLRRMTLLAVAGLCAVLVLLRWTVRNWLVLGSPVIFRSNLGLELAVSNNPWAAAAQLQNFADPRVRRLHPTLSECARREVRDMGEVAYNRMRMAEALNWIRENERKFLELTFHRVTQFWWPVHESSRFHLWAVRIATLLSVGGLLLMFRNRELALWFLAPAQVLFSLLYYLIHASTRLRFPVMWLTLLSAGHLLDRAGRWVRTFASVRLSN